MPKTMDYDNACDVCLKEMFKRVGETYPNGKLTGDPNWFQRRTWTQAEEDDFRDWLKKYLKKKYRWTNHTIKKEIGMFLLMWGWKVREE
jgi:hypothetical protein